METIQDYQDSLDGTDLGKQLDTQLKIASRHRAGRNFANMQVVSKDVMGHDGGDFNTRTKNKRISEGMLTTREGVNRVAEVIIHEEFHHGDSNPDGSTVDYTAGFDVNASSFHREGNENHSEGFVQWLTLDTLGAANNSAYQQEVTEIDAIAAKLGREKVRAIGRGKNPELNLWMAYIRHMIETGMDKEEANAEANSRMAAAA